MVRVGLRINLDLAGLQWRSSFRVRSLVHLGGLGWDGDRHLVAHGIPETRWGAMPSFWWRSRWRVPAISWQRFHDAGATSHAAGEGRQVLDCGSPLPLWRSDVRAARASKFAAGGGCSFWVHRVAIHTAFQSGRGLPQSTTLARLLTRQGRPPGLGLRKSSAALEIRRASRMNAESMSGRGLQFRARSVDGHTAFQSGRGLPQSTTLSRVLTQQGRPPGLGLRKSSAALEIRRASQWGAEIISGPGLQFLGAPCGHPHRIPKR